jgi:ankyrin repeat protein
MFNNLKVMQLALDNGVTFWDTAVSKAALYGHINAMEFAMNNGGSPRQGFFSASRAGKLDVLKWLLLRYDPSNDELERAIDAAEDFAHKDVMQFLRSKQNA